MSQIAKITARNTQASPSSTWVGMLVSVPVLFDTWRSRVRSRQALARLTPHLIQDVGLDAESWASEIRLPFWKE